MVNFLPRETPARRDHSISVPARLYRVSYVVYFVVEDPGQALRRSAGDITVWRDDDGDRQLIQTRKRMEEAWRKPVSGTVEQSRAGSDEAFFNIIVFSSEKSL